MLTLLCILRYSIAFELWCPLFFSFISNPKTAEFLFNLSIGTGIDLELNKNPRCRPGTTFWIGIGKSRVKLNRIGRHEHNTKFFFSKNGKYWFDKLGSRVLLLVRFFFIFGISLFAKYGVSSTFLWQQLNCKSVELWRHHILHILVLIIQNHNSDKV